MQPPDAKSGTSQTLRDTLAAATATLRRAGIEDAGNDARRLLGAVLGLSGAQVLASPDARLSAAQADRFAQLLGRRATREPVSRILGEREFYGRTFKLSPATLDPRPDSETLIDVALGFVGEAGLRAAPLRILDVGTGTGCLLTTLLCELPHATGLGTDISEAALQAASDNARRLGVADRATWRVADALDGLVGRFDIVVCNPPYIPASVIADLDPEVRDFDPRTALDGGSDGLDMYRRMAPRLAALVPSGWALFEVGYDQADAVADLLASATESQNSPRLSLHRDVAGMTRCVAYRSRA
jgi:release factor glutamine methyltransferase